MTSKQLQTLISAGFFSAALLTGVAYADDSTMPAATPAPTADASAAAPATPAATTPVKHHKHKMKAMPSHACAKQNSCKGQGGCKTGDGGCKAKNSCKGNGGCATDGSKK